MVEEEVLRDGEDEDVGEELDPKREVVTCCSWVSFGREVTSFRLG